MANVITVWQLDERFPGLLTADMVPAVQAGEACLVSAEIAEYYPTLTAWGELRRTDSEWTPSEAPHLPENTRYIFTSLGKADWDAAYPQCDSEAAEWDWRKAELPAGMSMVEAAHVMTHVRSHGPWESEQTHQSLVPYLLEETYELVDAIRDSDSGTADIVSELGDVFLEVLFHSAVGESATGDAHFTYDDVANSLLDKLKRRMPYAFNGGQFPATAAEQDALWQPSKKRENRSPFVGIVRSQPALSLASQVVKRARRAGVSETDIPLLLRKITDVDKDGRGSAEEKVRKVSLEFLQRLRGK